MIFRLFLTIFSTFERFYNLFCFLQHHFQQKISITIRDRPEITQVLFIFCSGKGGRGLSLLKIVNLRENLTKIGEGGLSLLKILNLRKTCGKTSDKREPLVPIDNNTNTVWLLRKIIIFQHKQSFDRCNSIQTKKCNECRLIFLKKDN